MRQLTKLMLLGLSLLAFQFGDWYFTCAVLDAGGTELNPIVRYVLDHGPELNLLAIKLLAATAIALYFVYRRSLKIAYVVNAVCALIFVWMAAQFWIARTLAHATH